jgi:hypothetical protein
MSRTVRDKDSGLAQQKDAQAQPYHEQLVAHALSLAPASDAKPQPATAPQRLGGRALYMRRAAPVGHPAPRSADEEAQKLSGRALMVARQKNGSRPLGIQR